MNTSKLRHDLYRSLVRTLPDEAQVIVRTNEEFYFLVNLFVDHMKIFSTGQQLLEGCISDQVVPTNKAQHYKLNGKYISLYRVGKEPSPILPIVDLSGISLEKYEDIRKRFEKHMKEIKSITPEIKNLVSENLWDLV